ncbi:predicted protein [Postia placenta Mad-698-R]|nr:predicted protein [Postia placenta Mad-698-R]
MTAVPIDMVEMRNCAASFVLTQLEVGATGEVGNALGSIRIRQERHKYRRRLCYLGTIYRVMVVGSGRHDLSHASWYHDDLFAYGYSEYTGHDGQNDLRLPKVLNHPTLISQSEIEYSTASLCVCPTAIVAANGHFFFAKANHNGRNRAARALRLHMRTSAHQSEVDNPRPTKKPKALWQQCLT